MTDNTPAETRAHPETRARPENLALHDALLRHQDALRDTARDLDDAAAGTRPTLSALTVGTVLKHVTGMQGRWVRVALAAPDPAPREDPALRDAEFVWGVDDHLETVLRDFDDVSAQVLDAVLALDPDSPGTDRHGNACTVRWVWFHVLEELTRHAGHADILREALDGTVATGSPAAHAR
ncbi:mycothiol transferase [Sanguibacter suaedae]|uniref:DUF664 domain-containing protein n=1 Tax=Sanguibacter suaedae TaxID=2795737 RepID=A0A934I1B9_9MICO|nr:DUF664 domain-containing protein [Sanguibacter suaedae]MBI9113764.1 DUF664 domain-containing protein [Sanguibacter suaedae]